MHITLTLTTPDAAGHHTTSYRGTRHPIGGRGTVMLRAADMRAATYIPRIYTSGLDTQRSYTLLVDTDGQEYTVRETPEQILAACREAAPYRYDVRDEYHMGRMGVDVAHIVSGAVEHSQAPALQAA